MKNSNQLRPEIIWFVVLTICITVSRMLLYQFDAMSDYGNFTPIGALALFGGAMYSGYRSYILPLMILWIGDIFLNRFVYYGEWRFFYEHFYWTYGAFILMALTGKLLIKKVNVKSILLSSIIITFIHWILTDFGVWLEGTMYPKTAAGFAMCLAAAIPYELYFLGGTLVFSGLLFGAEIRAKQSVWFRQFAIHKVSLFENKTN